MTTSPWVARVTCEAAPLQLEGTLADGRRLYCRARHGSWRVDVDGLTVAEGTGIGDGADLELFLYRLARHFGAGVLLVEAAP